MSDSVIRLVLDLDTDSEKLVWIWFLLQGQNLRIGHGFGQVWTNGSDKLRIDQCQRAVLSTNCFKNPYNKLFKETWSEIFSILLVWMNEHIFMVMKIHFVVWQQWPHSFKTVLANVSSGQKDWVVKYTIMWRERSVLGSYIFKDRIFSVGSYIFRHGRILLVWPN